MTEKIIIDCDPGQDDALMLFLALASPDDLDILGVVTVAGNVALEKTQRNARIICDLSNRTEVKVFAGYERPLYRTLEIADHVHGREGIKGIEIFTPNTPLQEQHGVDFIIQSLLAAKDEEITLVVTGPSTNIAHAILRERKILPKIKQIVLMGGALREGGNVTPSAEYNIYADPHAAQILYQCGRPIITMSLDVTHQAFTSADVLQRLNSLGSRAAAASYELIRNYEFFDAEKYGQGGAPLHDPVTVAYLLKPELFKLKSCNLRVETESELTIGHTSVDFWKETDNPENTLWAYEIDRIGFFDLLIDRIGRL